MSQLEHARWILERHLQWISAVETKTAVILSIDLAMLSALAVAFSELAVSERTAWGVLLAILGAIPLVVSVVHGARAIYPQTTGPRTSRIFFIPISEMSVDEFRSKFMAASENEQLEDCLTQVHRNAEIAKKKYACVSLSMKFAFLAVAPWIVAVGRLVFDNNN